jgi:hypothetical protein
MRGNDSDAVAGNCGWISGGPVTAKFAAGGLAPAHPRCEGGHLVLASAVWTGVNSLWRAHPYSRIGGPVALPFAMAGRQPFQSRRQAGTLKLTRAGRSPFACVGWPIIWTCLDRPAGFSDASRSP